MNNVNISRSHLMALRAGIAVLLTLVTILSLRLTAVPDVLPDVVAFQTLLKTSAAATIVDFNGKVTLFDGKLSPLEPCGESKDTTFPASCSPKEGSTLLYNNNVDLLVFGNKDKEYTDIILGTADTTYYYTLRRCPDNSCCYPNC